MRLKLWQWVVLATPLAIIIGFVLIAAGWQIHAWGISWIWGLFVLLLVGWRWLLVHWTKPMTEQIEDAIAQVNAQLEPQVDDIAELPRGSDAQAVLEKILATTKDDPPIWEDWPTFWQRCQDLVVSTAHIYHPQVKYPLLNIYVPQAYGLIRGTVDDLDQWMQKLSPTLNQVTIGQAYRAYEVYRQLEPSARKLWRVWNWAQWLINPAVAIAKTASQPYSNQANQQLLMHLGQMLRETALRNLSRQAIALYSGSDLPAATFNVSTPTLPTAKTQTLREILEQVEPIEAVEQKPVNILLVGRTGAGKSSLINTLFGTEQAQVDVLPSTEQIDNYHWQTQTGSTLTLWDTPGYEQINRADLRELVLDYATNADLLLLANPALDPSLQMDVDFLQDLKAKVADLPVITVVTQVDRLRPVRQWEPPYQWQTGERPKEISIRQATQYRAQLLGEFCDQILPVVTSDPKTNRPAWGIDALSLCLIDAIAPAKQLRLARFLRNQEARTVAAAKIIDHYTFQMTTTQGLTTLLKSPVLQFISTLSTGSPALAYALAQKIPVEQLPVVIGKVQMAYELFSLLGEDKTNFDLLALWPFLLDNSASPEREAWAFGHTLVEYWTQDLSVTQFPERVNFYLNLDS